MENPQNQSQANPQSQKAQGQHQVQGQAQPSGVVVNRQELETKISQLKLKGGSADEIAAIQKQLDQSKQA